MAACWRVPHASVQHLLPLQGLHELSLILPQSVCGLCPASQHRELSLYSYRPPARGCSTPRTHSFPLPPSVRPPPHRAALGPLTLPRGLTLRFGSPNAPHLQTSACTEKQTPPPGPARCSLPGPALQETRLLCPRGTRVLLATGKVPRLQDRCGDQSTGGCCFLAFWLVNAHHSVYCSLKAPKSLCFSKLSYKGSTGPFRFHPKMLIAQPPGWQTSTQLHSSLPHLLKNTCGGSELWAHTGPYTSSPTAPRLHPGHGPFPWQSPSGPHLTLPSPPGCAPPAPLHISPKTLLPSTFAQPHHVPCSHRKPRPPLCTHFSTVVD